MKVWLKLFINGILLNKWIYISLFLLYLLIYGETKNQSRYVLLFHESTGNFYHTSLTSPRYYSYLDRFNIFDGDDVFYIKSYNAKYLHYIGNVKNEKKVDTKVEIKSVQFLPQRNYVDFNQLPEIIKKSTAPDDICDVDVTGIESLGLTKFKMIMGESGESLENALKERSDKFKEQNTEKVP